MPPEPRRSSTRSSRRKIWQLSMMRGITAWSRSVSSCFSICRLTVSLRKFALAPAGVEIDEEIRQIEEHERLRRRRYGSSVLWPSRRSMRAVEIEIAARPRRAAARTGRRRSNDEASSCGRTLDCGLRLGLATLRLFVDRCCSAMACHFESRGRRAAADARRIGRIIVNNWLKAGPPRQTGGRKCSAISAMRRRAAVRGDKPDNRGDSRVLARGMHRQATGCNRRRTCSWITPPPSPSPARSRASGRWTCSRTTSPTCRRPASRASR